MKVIFSLMLFFSIMRPGLGEHYRIQIVLTNPRSVSTAFEKAMLMRKDHKILHEPWNTSSMFHNGDAHVFNQLPPQEVIDAKNYEGVKQLIYQYAKEQRVFVKDMVWSIKEDILKDDALFSDEEVTLTILIREPALAMESYFVKAAELYSAEETSLWFDSIFCYDVLYQLAEKYHQIRGKWPIILRAEELCRNPEETIQAFCKQAEIEYMPEMISWQKGQPSEWNHLSDWHTDASKSTGFYIPNRDRAGIRFSNIPEMYRVFIEELYQQQKPYYDKLNSL